MSAPSDTPAVAPAVLLPAAGRARAQKQQHDQLHSGKTMNGQKQVQGLTRDAALCAGGNIARFTRPVRPTYHCGDPACACMTTTLAGAVTAFLASWDRMTPNPTRDAPVIASLRAALAQDGTA